MTASVIVWAILVNKIDCINLNSNFVVSRLQGFEKSYDKTPSLFMIQIRLKIRFALILIQWNLSVATTSIYLNILPLVYSVMCFNEDWKYQLILANNFCLLELIQLALGHLDELQEVEKYPIRWSLETGFTVLLCDRCRNVNMALHL